MYADDDKAVVRLCFYALVFIGAVLFLACAVHGVWWLGLFVFCELLLFIPAYYIAPKIYDWLSRGRSPESETQSAFGLLSFFEFMPGVFFLTWLCLAAVPVLILALLVH